MLKIYVMHYSMKYVTFTVRATGISCFSSSSYGAVCLHAASFSSIHYITPHHYIYTLHAYIFKHDLPNIEPCNYIPISQKNCIFACDHVIITSTNAEWYSSNLSLDRIIFNCVSATALTLTVLVTTIDALRHFETGVITAQCEGMGEVGSARYEPALLPPCPSIRVLCYSNCQRSTQSHQQFKG